MAIEKRTVVSQIELTAPGVVQVRLEKQVVEDGVVISREYHRTSIEPGLPAEDQMLVVNRHLRAMKCAEVEAHEIDRIKRIAALEHRPEVVLAFGALREAHQAVRAAEAANAAAAKTHGPDSKQAADTLAAAQSAMAAAEVKYRELVETVRRRSS